MKEASLRLAKAFTLRIDPDAVGELQAFLPSSDASFFESCHPSSLDSSIKGSESFDQIHYSWLLQSLSKMQRERAAASLSLLEPKQREKMEQMLESSLPEVSTTPFGQKLLGSIWRKEIRPSTILPRCCLPESPWSPLLNMKQSTLFELIDLLGIYDLAHALRSIVDRKLLTSLYPLLSERQLHFLHFVRRQPKKWTPPPWPFASWDQSKRSFLHELHRRGLYRLGRALHDADPSFLWHFIHRLDTGRGEIVKTNSQKREEPHLTKMFAAELLDLINRVQES